jgi:hypothetical protein
MAEIVTCPACSKNLQVPEDFFGKTVQCPECKQTFLAQAAAPASSAASVSASPGPAAPSVPAWEQPPARSARDEDEERPRRPSRRRDEDDDDDRPSRRRLAAHRGGMILAFGIMALVMGALGLVFGPMAWVMGNADLREMRAGRMDPSGEGQTNTGRILGMVATILHVFGLLIGCLVGVLFFIAAIGGAAAHRHH